MANKHYRQRTSDGEVHIAQRFVKQGRKPLPIELKSVRVNITLSPQAKSEVEKLLKISGKTFSAWITDQIYNSIHTEIA